MLFDIEYIITPRLPSLFQFFGKAHKKIRASKHPDTLPCLLKKTPLLRCLEFFAFFNVCLLPGFNRTSECDFGVIVEIQAFAQG